MSSVVSAAEPALLRTQDHWIELAGLPSPLNDAEIRDHLSSGLTTTLEIRVSGSGRRSSKPLGGARIEIRYELWEEAFHLTVYELGKLPRELQLASEDELESWWPNLHLRLLELGPEDSMPSDEAHLALQVIPFSHAEQVDTQRWFSEAVHRDSRKSTEGPGLTGRDSAPLERVFGVLIATSIQRRPLVTRTWTLPWPREVRLP